MIKEKIKLSNEQIYDINEIKYRSNLLEIKFDENVDINALLEDMSLFSNITLLTRGGAECGNYKDYSTIYLHEENTIILSNDDSVYIESEPSTGNQEELQDPYIPTLEEVQQNKIRELSNICNNSIEYGVDIDINGVIEHFSYKANEDQANIKDAFDLALSTNMNIPYHCNDGNCKLYTPEQIINLYIAEKTNLTHHTTYFNQMKMYILSLTEAEEIKNIFYGQELVGEYLDTYNVAMNQASLVIEKLLENHVDQDNAKTDEQTTENITDTQIEGII